MATSAVPADPQLFANVAKLTRQLHQALAELNFDQRLASIAGTDMPDAALRLDHVVKITEEAAHRTLDLVEQAQRCLEPMARAGADVAPLRAILSQLATAQEYQDIAGQVLRKVTALVRNVESALLDLLCATGGRPPLQKAAPAPIGTLHGPAVPDGRPAASQQDADELLASLGF